MARLWEVMTEAFGHRWSGAFHETPNKTWTRALAELTNEQMARGVTKTIASAEDWPPSVGKFRDLCLGSYADHGLLPAASAWKAAGQGRLEVRGIYHAITQVSTPYDFRRMPADKAQRLFEKAWAITLEHCREGRPLRQPPSPVSHDRRLEEQGPNEAMKRRGEDALRQIRERLNMNREPGEDDEQASGEQKRQATQEPGTAETPDAETPKGP